MTKLARLPRRGVIELSGDDRVVFLQGLVSNDVAQAAPGRAVWAALLTPQGKYLADFFIHATADHLLLDCEAAQAPGLVTRLTRHRLRSRVTLQQSEQIRVYAAWSGTPDEAGTIDVAPDPRLSAAGWRILADRELAETADETAWDAHRIALGLPDGTRDLEPEKTVLLEAGFDELNGVSWTKGCYLGQELTARTKYRGLLKRRLLPVTIDGDVPDPGTPILANGAEAGTMRSASGHHGLAVLRIEALGAPLNSGAATVTPRTPDWMRLP